MTSQIIMPNESKMNIKDLDNFQRQLLSFTNKEFARKAPQMIHGEDHKHNEVLLLF